MPPFLRLPAGFSSSDNIISDISGLSIGFAIFLSDISDTGDIISDIADFVNRFRKILSDISDYFLCYNLCTLCYIACYLAGGRLD